MIFFLIKINPTLIKILNNILDLFNIETKLLLYNDLSRTSFSVM